MGTQSLRPKFAGADKVARLPGDGTVTISPLRPFGGGFLFQSGCLTKKHITAKNVSTGGNHVLHTQDSHC